MLLVRHVHVHDGEHHENERLQHDDKNMEDRPGYTQYPLNPERHQLVLLKV